MHSAANIVNAVKASYTIAIMGVLGVFAFVSAVLIAWPALAYLGANGQLSCTRLDNNRGPNTVGPLSWLLALF